MTERNEFGQGVFDAVRSLLDRANRTPFLFIGSGISRRYMGTEDWEGLLAWVCEQVGPPMKPLYVYREMARNELPDSRVPYPLMARLMSADFLQALGDPSMAEWAERHREDFEQRGISPFKVFLCDHLRRFSPCMLMDEFAALQGASNHVAGVITTNYDDLVDRLFPSYQRYARQEDLLFSQITGVGEIFKIHGSADDPDSLIITDRDYRKFEERKAYLTAKIMTIFGEYPIIFLGYSLNDPDVLGIISAIADCAGETRAKELASRFVFVEYARDPAERRIDPRHGVVVAGGGQIEMTAIHTADFKPIYDAIASTRQLYTPRLLGQLGRQVYSLIYSGTSTETVVSKDLEHMDQLPPDAKIVIGLDARNFGRRITGDDIYRDVLFHDQSLDVNLVVGAYLDDMLRSQDVPMFHYLSRYDGPLGERTREKLAEKTSLEDYLSQTERKARTRLRPRLPSTDVKGLVAKFGKDAYKHVTLLRQEEISVPELEALIRPVAKRMFEKDGRLDPPIRKDIRMLDFLRDGVPYRSRPDLKTKN
ncbi:SIR2 family protein [Bifidobacterium vespertilionis]|uniref:SIR2 family protein n=1 Tax=Bifidobacterium vespertilionis TaxID=2562524 RepID=UPI001BDBDBBD|nr:SIR2 family protein [Bifidobacterium vespertilionis]MBT1179640.1 SIR2 family protein [Bifidobacterium vespertilionis]